MGLEQLYTCIKHTHGDNVTIPVRGWFGYVWAVFFWMRSFNLLQGASRSKPSCWTRELWMDSWEMAILRVWCWCFSQIVLSATPSTTTTGQWKRGWFIKWWGMDLCLFSLRSGHRFTQFLASFSITAYHGFVWLRDACPTWKALVEVVCSREGGHVCVNMMICHCLMVYDQQDPWKHRKLGAEKIVELLASDACFGTDLY